MLLVEEQECCNHVFYKKTYAKNRGPGKRSWGSVALSLLKIIIFDDNRNIHSIEQLNTYQILNLWFGFKPSIYIKNVDLINC